MGERTDDTAHRTKSVCSVGDGDGDGDGNVEGDDDSTMAETKVEPAGDWETAGIETDERTSGIVDRAYWIQSQ